MPKIDIYHQPGNEYGRRIIVYVDNVKKGEFEYTPTIEWIAEQLGATLTHHHMPPRYLADLAQQADTTWGKD